MANWAWPHTPASDCARLVLSGGPFDGEQVGFLPPDTPAPAQIAWAGWLPWGFDAYLYEWHGERTMDRGRTDALVYTPAQPARLDPATIPPLIGEWADVWADGAAMIASAFAVPAELIWPGV